MERENTDPTRRAWRTQSQAWNGVGEQDSGEPGCVRKEEGRRGRDEVQQAMEQKVRG